MIEAGLPVSPLLSHQPDGIARLTGHPQYNLGWDMGLAKTSTVGAAIRSICNTDGDPRILILCPPYLMWTWHDQLLEHNSLKSVVCEGTAPKREKMILRWRATGGILILSYGVIRQNATISLLMLGHKDGQMNFRKDREKSDLNGAIIVADECHNLKTHSSKQSKGAHQLAERFKYRWALTGTPVPNSELDSYGWMRYLYPKDMESYWAFKKKYALTGGYAGKEILGLNPSTASELKRRILQCCHRLKKEDVLDLPPKTIENVFVDLAPEARKAYDKLKREKIIELAGTELSVPLVLAETNKLLQIAGGFAYLDDGTTHYFKENAKLKALMEIVEDNDDPTIVFASYIPEAEAIAKALGDCYLIAGGKGDRRSAVSGFQNGDKRFIVATTPSLSQGVTLTRATRSVFYSRTFNLVDWLQAQDRNYRVGQDKPVTVLSLVARRTVDGVVNIALEKKARHQEAITTPEGVIEEMIAKGATWEDFL